MTGERRAEVLAALRAAAGPLSVAGVAGRVGVHSSSAGFAGHPACWPAA